jgi:ribosome-interacting GTPase 1
VPANLTPQYKEAEEVFRQARTPREKMEALEEMLRVIPKHKGTEKLRADLRKRLSKLRKKETTGPSRSQHRPFHQIDKEGAGRVVVCGPPNSGKSTLVDCLTRARPEVADYPFTTRVPVAGMMDFEDVQIQLIDTPPLAPATLEGWLLQMMVQCEVLLLLFDVNDPDLLEQTDYVLGLLSERGIPGPEGPKLLVLAGQADRPGADENLQIWEELFADRLQARPFSARDERMVEELRGRLFQLLEVVRVYTKRPGHSAEADSAPFLLKRGATVIDAAACVHRDFASSFRFARIWRSPDRNGQMIDRHDPVQDRDLLEIHAS